MIRRGGQTVLRQSAGGGDQGVGFHDLINQAPVQGLIRAGLRNREIASRCGLTEGTVKVHLHSIFQKLSIKSRSELIIMMMSMDSDMPAVGMEH